MKNVPQGREVILDHSGHFVHDAEAAARSLGDLGFTVTPYSAQVQPDPRTGEPRLTGTGNVCVMLPEGYLEFLVHTADTPIGLEFKAALSRRAGVHLAAFAVADAEKTHAALTKAGFPMRPLAHFSRPVDTVTGTAIASFTVARLQQGVMPEGRVQVLTHHDVETMWQPRWTRHRNGAIGLEAILIATPDPRETAARFAGFLGGDPRPLDGGLRLVLDRGALEFWPEQEATALLGDVIEPGHSVFAGLRVSVASLAEIESLIRDAGHRVGSGLVLPFAPALGRGAWIFEERGAGP